MNAFAAANSYKDVGLETSVMGADSHKLVAMLYQGALLAISEAKYEMQNRHTETKGKAVSKAISIIGEGLQASLDMNVGGEIAQNLFSLYGYMVKRLAEANLNNDTAMLDEVTQLLTELQNAWNAIRPQVVQPAAA
jgi:flagellar secretion chaperone FliS